MKDAPLFASFLITRTFHSKIPSRPLRTSSRWKMNEGQACGFSTAPKISANSPALITLLSLRLVMLSAVHRSVLSFASSFVFISAKAHLLWYRTTPLWFLTTHVVPRELSLLFQSKAILHINQSDGGGTHLGFTHSISFLCFTSIYVSTIFAKNHSSESDFAFITMSPAFLLVPSNMNLFLLFQRHYKTHGQALLFSFDPSLIFITPNR